MHNQKRMIEFEDGTFKPLFLDFIRYQQSLGYKYRNSSIYALRSINRDLNRMNLTQEQPCLSKKMIESLAEKRPNETFGTQKYRIGLLRQFSLYMNSLGFDAYLFPKRFLPKNHSDFRPYIFSSHLTLCQKRVDRHGKSGKVVLSRTILPGGSSADQRDLSYLDSANLYTAAQATHHSGSELCMAGGRNI